MRSLAEASRVPPHLVHAAEELPVERHQLIGHFLGRHVVQFAVSGRPVDLLRKRKLRAQEMTSSLHLYLLPDVQ